MRKYQPWVLLAQLPFLEFVRAATETDTEGLDGDEFSNNLFSDLAPLLALFGERVATQYLRHSTRKLENLIFACAPLGLLTAVSAAIRVGGNRKMKALIGRAEEAEAEAEIELMSSTSEGTCELWNGSGLVRVIGEHQILELIYHEELSTNEIQDDQMQDGQRTYGLHTRETGMMRAKEDASSDDSRSTDSNTAPNISLNTTSGTMGAMELWIVAFLGVCIQLGVLAFAGAATYHWKWAKGGNPVATYAFPLTFIGTLSIVVGMYLCANVVEAKTQEVKWVMRQESAQKKKLQIIWLQRGHTVGDQGFKPFVIYAPAKQTCTYLMTSRKREDIKGVKLQETMTSVATVVSIAGFITQFVGLRAMHFSASIAQLIATALMTILRVVIRRGISQSHQDLHSPEDIPSDKTHSIRSLNDGHELDCLAMQLQKCGGWRVMTYGTTLNQENRVKRAKHVLGTRVRLANLLRSPWHTMLSEHAVTLSSTVEGIAKLVWDLHKSKALLELKPNAMEESRIICNILVETVSLGSGSEWSSDVIELEIQRNRSQDKWMPWKTDHTKVEALLQLWVLQLQKERPGRSLTQMHCDWWIGTDYEITENGSLEEICRNNDITVRNHDSTNPDHSRILDYGKTVKTDGPQDTGNPRAVIKNTTFPDMCVHYILYTFIFEISQFIEGINSETTITEYKGHSVRSVMLGNDTVWALAKEAQKTGLITMSDAYLIVVCALHGRGILPDLSGLQEEVMKLAANIEENKQNTPAKLQNLLEVATKLCEEEVKARVSRDQWLKAGEFLVKAIKNCEKYLKSGAGSQHAKQLRNMRTFFQDNLVDEIKSLNIALDKTPRQSFSDSEDLTTTLRQGALSTALALMQDEKKVNQVGEAGITALEYAASSLNKPLAMLLLLYGAHVRTTTAQHVSPVWRAVDAAIRATVKPKSEGASTDESDPQGACTGILTLLISSGADIYSIPVNIKSKKTALVLALKHGFHEVVASLLGQDIMTHRATLFLGDEDGRTALHYAAATGHIKAAERLLKSGAPVDVEDTDEQRPLHKAVQSSGPEALAIIRLLRENGAQLESGDKQGKRPLHLAGANEHPGALTIIQLLLGEGAMIDSQDQCGDRPLGYAVSNKGPDVLNIVQLLLDRGALIHDQNDVCYGSNLLGRAIENPVAAAPLVQLLLDRGAPVGIGDKSGNYPLHHAARNESPEALAIVQKLLAMEKGPVMETQERVSDPLVLKYAVQNKGPHALGIVKQLLEKGARINTDQSVATSQGTITPLHHAVQNKGPDALAIVRELLKKGARINIEDAIAHGEYSPLHCAVQEEGPGAVAIVEELLKRGARTETGYSGIRRRPLHLAASSKLSNAPAMVELLLKYNAEIEGVDGYGEHPLHHAVENKGFGALAIVQRLLHKGALIESESNALARPLHLAVENEGPTALKIVQLLLEYGADVNAKREDGKTPLDIAREKKLETMIKILEAWIPEPEGV